MTVADSPAGAPVQPGAMAFAAGINYREARIYPTLAMQTKRFIEIAPAGPGVSSPSAFAYGVRLTLSESFFAT